MVPYDQPEAALVSLSSNDDVTLLINGVGPLYTVDFGCPFDDLMIRTEVELWNEYTC